MSVCYVAEMSVCYVAEMSVWSVAEWSVWYAAEITLVSKASTWCRHLTDGGSLLLHPASHQTPSLVSRKITTRCVDVCVQQMLVIVACW